MQVVLPDLSVVTQAAVVSVVSQYAPLAQPVLVAAGAVPVALHVVLHAVALAQEKFDGQGAPVPAVQLPALLHDPAPAVVMVEPEQVAVPHAVVAVGYAHAPVPLLQDVAPQVPLVMHAAAQQLPVPLVPQMPLVHALLVVHVAPAATLGTHVPEVPGLLQ